MGKIVVALWVLLVAAAAQADDTTPPQIVHEPCGEYKRGEPFEIMARFHDESAIFDPKLIYRSAGESSWKNIGFQKTDRPEFYRAMIRGKELRGPLEYFIEVFDENGNGPARLGAPDAPVRVTPSANPGACQQVSEPPAAAPVVVAPTPSVFTPAPPLIVHANPAHADPMTAPKPAPAGSGSEDVCAQADRPLYCEPLLWGVLGGVVLAGAGVATYFIVSKDSSSPPSGQSHNEVSISVSAPNPVSSALRGHR